MKILVINEFYVRDYCRTQRWAARTRGRVLRPPDWLAYASAVLEQAGHQVKLADMVVLNQGKDDLKAMVIREKPDLVVLDSATPSIYSDIECARVVKDNSRAAVVMVGPHVSALPAETLELAKGAVDVGCIGEYDFTVRDVAQKLDRLEEVPGIAFMRNGAVVVTGARPLIEDLDSLPFPAWHQLDMMKYFDGGKLYPYIDIISGRGCPNQCIFCLWPQVMHGTRYRLRSAANVIAEMERDIALVPQVARGGEFFFEDDTFTVLKDRAMEICELMLAKNLKATFSVNARVDTADEELFRVMKRAGCRELLVGFESGSQSQLNTMHKNLSVERSFKFMELAKKTGLDVHGCFVIGLPGETDESARETIEFALKLGLTTAQFSGAVPFPGTKFYELCRENSWIRAEKWSDWLSGGEQSGIVEYPGMDRAKINRYVDEGLKKFYFRPLYMINFIARNRSFADLYRKFRGAFNFLTYLWQKH